MSWLKCKSKDRLGSEVWEMLGKAGLDQLFQDLGDDQEHSPVGNQNNESTAQKGMIGAEGNTYPHLPRHNEASTNVGWRILSREDRNSDFFEAHTDTE